MPNYRYQVKSNDGQVSVGVIAADNATAAANNHMLRHDCRTR